MSNRQRYNYFNFVAIDVFMRTPNFGMRTMGGKHFVTFVTTPTIDCQYMTPKTSTPTHSAAAWFQLLRPQQWIKNLFVFAPVFFGAHARDYEQLTRSAIGFVCFCFVASSIYCLNDWVDRHKDRKHPTKCRRPIASGLISPQVAALSTLLLFLCALGIAWFCRHHLVQPSSFGSILILYWVVNWLYCFWLKKIALVDVFVVAFGFILRIHIGAAATGIEVSEWLLLMTLLLTLFLTLAKRRDDILLLEQTGQGMRSNLNGYNRLFLDQVLSILAGTLLICYILYTFSSGVKERLGQDAHLYYTVLPVLFGLLRYLQLTLVYNQSGSPTKIVYTDRITQICVLAWLLSFVYILYIRPILPFWS